MNKKENYIALARVICAFAVVMIHTNSCFNEFNIKICWFHANVIDCGLGFAVPVFIMISGATLLDYRDRYSTKEFFIKRIKKIGIPFLIWSIISVLYMKLTDKVGIFFVYLFFIQLFVAYLSIPVLSLIKNERREKVFMSLIPILIIINYLIPNLNNYVFYLLIGYILSKKVFSNRSKYIIYVLAFVGLAVHIGGTYLCSIEEGMIIHTFRGYTNLPTCLSAIGVFLFIKEIGQGIQNDRIIKIIDAFSGYTFPIYLLHYYIIQLIIEPLGFDTHTLLYNITASFATCTISVIFTWVIRKIPVVKKCFGV